MIPMRLKAKIGVATAISLFALLMVTLTINAHQSVSYRHLDYVTIKAVMDWPPVSADDFFHQSEYTPPSRRGSLQLLSTRGVRAIDDSGFEYLLSGTADISTGIYSLQTDAAERKFRLCSATEHCVVLTERNSLSRPRS